MKTPHKTQIGIIGAGPSGLMLAHLLRAQGIDSVILESRSRQYVEDRVRAGVLEQGTVDLIEGLGLGARMRRQGLVHNGIELGVNRKRHRIDLHALTGKDVTVYGQHEVVKDLIGAAAERDIPIMFEATDVQPHCFDGDSPSISFVHDGQSHELHCDFIAGCDGFHGICRSAVPSGVLTSYDRTYPFSWLGILADAPPSQHELVYMLSSRGFALFSMRSPAITRLYLQCAPDEDLAQWPDERIWDELDIRLQCDDGWKPNRGPVLQKSITGMRSFVTEPMQYGRLFLAGDAVHIVPPTGAKGMNLAISDVKVLSECFTLFYKHGRDTTVLQQYSEVCLRRIWKAQRFSWHMTSMLHLDPQSSPFDRKRQLAELDYVTHSKAASTSIAESYVGLPIESV